MDNFQIINSFKNVYIIEYNHLFVYLQNLIQPDNESLDYYYIFDKNNKLQFEKLYLDYLNINYKLNN